MIKDHKYFNKIRMSIKLKGINNVNNEIIHSWSVKYFTLFLFT